MINLINKLINNLKPIDCGYELIRVGSDGDGGYLLPDDLDGIEYCFSPGVGSITEFEQDLAKIGIKSFMADYSIDKLVCDNNNFIFDKKNIGCIDSNNLMTLDSWKDKYLNDYSKDLMMQMDIEGYEYMNIINISEKLLKQFRIMVIEFHFLDHMVNYFCFINMSSCFEKILKYFDVVHIHPNNYFQSIRFGNLIIPKIMEFSFIRKDRVLSRIPRNDFPHKLDRDNVPGNTQLILPECWYNQ